MLVKTSLIVTLLPALSTPYTVIPASTLLQQPYTPMLHPYTPLLLPYHPYTPFRTTLSPGPSSTYFIASEGSFSPTPSEKDENDEKQEKEEEAVTPTLYVSSLARASVNMDICYFLGQDILTSHVPCNPNWGDGTAEGVRRYINEMTLETNKLIGLDNMRLAWKGPYERHDFQEKYPGNPSYDTLSASTLGCDVVVFLIFNEFDANCVQTSEGHKYAGMTKGAMCEAAQGTGYAAVVDQGFLNDVWVGPQILAHHLLMMMTSDLADPSKHCPDKGSLLYPGLYAGKQRVDQCVADKLSRSGIWRRSCLRQ